MRNLKFSTSVNRSMDRWRARRRKLSRTGLWKVIEQAVKRI